jgi:hypothetical protein
MIQLVLTFCLAASSTSCMTVRPPFERGYASLRSCMIAAEFIAADMLRDRLDLQGYRLERWRCGPGAPPGSAT